MADKNGLAPEGGWGWLIVTGYAVSNMINIPILQGFALLFRNTFVELRLAALDISMIINVNSSFGFLFGLFNGPMLKTFGCRKVGLFGSVLMFFGFVLTSRASTFTEFIIYYGLIFSAGIIITVAAFGLALNTYFVKRRNRASGLCMTATGLGPVFMPLVISRLVDMYGERGTALIISGLSLHSLAAVLLLQPVEWHYRQPDENSATDERVRLNADLEAGGRETMKKKKRKRRRRRRQSESGEDYKEIEACTGTGFSFEPSLVPRRFSDAQLLGRRALSLSLPQINGVTAAVTAAVTAGVTAAGSVSRLDPEPCWWSKSLHHIGRPQPEIRTETDVPFGDKFAADPVKKCDSVAADLSDEEKEENGEGGKEKDKLKWYQVIANIFDLDLLKDPGYRTIWLGMSIAFTAEINFSLMTPIILGDRGWDVEGTARIMSAIGIADILFRFVSPFVGEWVDITARYMYMYSILMLVVFRGWLTFVESYWATMAVCVGLGVAKGFRTVYMTLVIPNCVPLEKLPSASGLQTVLNGVLLMCFGPLLGYIRDVTGSYNLCIHAMNTLSSITILMWTLEYLTVKRDNSSRI